MQQLQSQRRQGCSFEKQTRAVGVRGAIFLPLRGGGGGGGRVRANVPASVVSSLRSFVAEGKVQEVFGAGGWWFKDQYVCCCWRPSFVFLCNGGGER
ncbi:hypothetical protein E2C01_004191 [Portunus trituberculatus]|uniref:Uncharacterized protein n=1 Tax=Portunus trituberculatus TaxID=210409 RepID=A0A5B7CSD5_PORTR|nr:hypothetical protein [Portunus trituberculatus]